MTPPIDIHHPRSPLFFTWSIFYIVEFFNYFYFRVLDFNVIGMLFIYFLILTSGLVGYATYVDCDPLASGKIKKGAEILAYFVMDKLGHIWGLPGLFAATLIGGTLRCLLKVYLCIHHIVLLS